MRRQMKLVSTFFLGVAILLMGCGGGGSDGPPGATSMISVNALFEPYTGRVADGSVGCLQVTLVDTLGVAMAPPAVLSRGNASAQFGPFANGTQGVLQVRAFHALNPTGPLLAFSNISTIAGATGQLDVSTNLTTSITGITINVPTNPPLAPFQPGESYTLIATAKNGDTVVLTSVDDTSFQFSVAPQELGSINPTTNVFTASSSVQQELSGDISVTYHGFTASGPITVKGEVPQFHFKVKWGSIEYSRDVAGYVGGIGVVLTNTLTGVSVPAFFARPATAAATEQEYFFSGPSFVTGHCILQVEGFTGNSDANRGQPLGLATTEFDLPVTPANQPIISARLDERIDRIIVTANGADIPVGGAIDTFVGSTVNLSARAVDSADAILLTDKFIRFSAPLGQTAITLNDELKFFSGANAGSTVLTAKLGVQTGMSVDIPVNVF